MGTLPSIADLETSSRSSYINIVKLAKDVDCDIVVPEKEHTAVCIPAVDLSGKHEEDWKEKVDELNHHIHHVKQHSTKSEKHHAGLKEHMEVMKESLQVFGGLLLEYTGEGIDLDPLISEPTLKAAQKFKSALKRVGSSSKNSSKKYQLDTRNTVG